MAGIRAQHAIILGLLASACEGPSSTSASDGAAADATGAVNEVNDGDGAVVDATGAVNDGTGAASAVCERWNQDHGGREGTWSGSTATCDPGTYAEPGPDNALRQVNLYRWLAGLPAVALDPAKSAAAQACALMMHANDSITHVVPETWKCWSPEGAAAAGLSNLATTPAVASTDLYIVDQNVANLGHRRWLLSNSLGPIGVGSTSRYSCMHVLSGDGDARRRWVAWPPEGDVPIQALRVASWLDTDAAGWSVQSDYIDVRGGDVTVMRDGAQLAVSTWVLDGGYGSSFGLGIRPVGWRTEVGGTYDVTVTGIAEPIAWRFTVVDCD